MAQGKETGKGGSRVRIRDYVVTPVRLNVLLLVGAGYVTVLVMFTAMVCNGKMEPSEAYDVVKGPLMALIGGSLAISKDLIPARSGQARGRAPQRRQRSNAGSAPIEPNQR